ncbi:MAG: hypothetical protein HYZ14_06930 [Bacteroidetes bacterium]|nr:hypothetical protein [Bacteroidota bacterium]
MKKIILGVVTGVLFVAITSCGGGGHNCDAYNKADYTKYKTTQKKIN